MDTQFNPADHPHRRFNALTGEWVLVSPHRSKRPWKGQSETLYEENVPSYDADCYLCAGNRRMSGDVNPNYQNTFVFKNDFAALQPEIPDELQDDELFRLQAEQGEARVICYSPDHSKTLPELDLVQINRVIQCWIEQVEDLGRHYPYVQLFENKGATMGSSIPHPHGQVWAQKHMPTELAKEQSCQSGFWQKHKKKLLLEYARREIANQERVVDHNQHWLALVPFWASWPFETLLLPTFPVERITQLTTEQRQSLAAILKSLTTRYDNLFATSFPYSMGWHGAPMMAGEFPEWQLHAHFYPPLLRSASVKKFMVGYEMWAEPQRDITPEQAAAKLRDLSTEHFRKREK